MAAITFYSCDEGYCGDPAGPLPLAGGQAACGPGWDFGMVLLVEGDPLGPVVCNDTGLLGLYQVDRFFWESGPRDGSTPGTGWWWQKQVGSRARVKCIENC